ncbi:MotA/TolQ/ExbB proton channel family protein [Treponema sp. R80B11-R83G3]
MVFIFTIVGILSGAAAIFIDLPSALLIIVPLIFFFLISKSGKILGEYIKSSFKKEHIYTEAELSSLSTALKNTIKFIFTLGGFGFMTGLIASLAFLETSDKLGPNIAIALITVLYPIAISCFVFFPVKAWAENKINMLRQNGERSNVI